MQLTRGTAVLGWMCSTMACTTTLPPETPLAAAGTAQIQIIETPAQSLGQTMLPAYETGAERASRGLFDQYDDFRLANKQWFARTVPPKVGQLRSMNEWEPMQEVWTTYTAGMPADKPVRRMFAEQSIAFAKAGLVRVIVPGQVEANDFVAALLQYGMAQGQIDAKVKFVVMPHNSVWHIDYGPLPMIDKADGHQAFLDFAYYKSRPQDDAIPTRLGQEYFKTVTTYRMPFGFEGGNFQADGLGRCTTSTRALKNTGYSELKVLNLLKNYAGCDKTLIMKDITDDGTGHIDMFFKWLGPDSVMIGEYEAKITFDWPGLGPTTVAMPDSVATELSSDFKVPYQQVWLENKQRMDDNAALWASTKAPNGNLYKVYRLPMMTRFADEYGDVPRTFINSTFFNEQNVYPAYTLKSCRNPFGKACTDYLGCAVGQHCAAGKCTSGAVAAGCDELLACSNGQECTTDPLKVALQAKVDQVWKAALPTMTHVAVRADTIALWSGAIHCITRTIPAKPLAKTIADGLCVSGTCGCSDGGSGQTCSDSAQCFGPQWVCDCTVGKGVCSGGKACTDDADCSLDGSIVIAASCAIDPKQGCYGQPPGGGGTGLGPCGTVSYEGQCDGKALSYCDATLKNQACSGCCGWDAANKYFNCLSGAACTSCQNECSSAQVGCSSAATHAWTCANVNGCWKRQFSYCAKGCSVATGTCSGGTSGGSMVDKCPTSGQPDAGSTDTAVADSAPADAGTTDTKADAGSDLAAAEVSPADSALGDIQTADTAAIDAVMVDSAGAETTVAEVSPADAAAPDAKADSTANDTAAADSTGGDARRGNDVSVAEVGVTDAQSPDVVGAVDATAPDEGRVPANPDAGSAAADDSTNGAGIGAASDTTTTSGNGSSAGVKGGLCSATSSAQGSWNWLCLVPVAALFGWRRRQPV
ncbi:MAG: hypothetical protein EXR77_11210 [Myxococcales bacterium]|nr:hypothetical protein [Myxococcales bacterium]